MLSDQLARLREGMSGRIVGNEETIDHVLVCLVAGGHMLIESPPGLGKTELSKALCEAMDMEFRRIQCTPDLAPSDVTGELRPEGELGRLFHRGPLFSNIVLVDEINRAQPKTQAAFLEAMAEGQVSSDGKAHALPRPFMLIATQNPIESEGTFPLPEAQQDRFLMKSRMGYLTPEDEARVILKSGRVMRTERIFAAHEVLILQEQAACIPVGGPCLSLIVSIAQATRCRTEAAVGASTRAAVALSKAAKARAFLMGRVEVSVGDVAALAAPVLGHRMVMNPDARDFGFTSEALIEDILRKLSANA